MVERVGIKVFKFFEVVCAYLYDVIAKILSFACITIPRSIWTLIKPILVKTKDIGIAIIEVIGKVIKRAGELTIDLLKAIFNFAKKVFAKVLELIVDLFILIEKIVKKVFLAIKDAFVYIYNKVIEPVLTLIIKGIKIL